MGGLFESVEGWVPVIRRRESEQPVSTSKGFVLLQVLLSLLVDKDVCRP